MRTLRVRLVLVPASVLLLGLFGLPTVAEAAGPWRAKIVDAESGQALEGVVVLAWWLKYTGGPAGWAGGRYYAPEEVVTGPDGKFEIPAKLVINWLPFITEIRGPEFRIFKPGYGQGRAIEPDLTSGGEPMDDADLFVREGVVLALTPLKTREERLVFYRRPGRRPPMIIPQDRTRRFYEADDVERKYLGFGR